MEKPQKQLMLRDVHSTSLQRIKWEKELLREIRVGRTWKVQNIKSETNGEISPRKSVLLKHFLTYQDTCLETKSRLWYTGTD